MSEFTDLDVHVDSMLFKHTMKNTNAKLIESILAEYERRLDTLSADDKEKLLSELKSVLEAAMNSRSKERALAHLKLQEQLLGLTNAAEEIRSLLPNFAKL